MVSWEQNGYYAAQNLLRVPEEIVRRIQESFERSPRKSTRRASRELGIPQPTVWRVLRRRLLFKWVHLFESICILNCVGEGGQSWRTPLLISTGFDSLLLTFINICYLLNPLTAKDPYSGRTAPLTPKRCIWYIYSTNTHIEYFTHGIYCPFFSLQNAVCFIILTYLVPILFTFYIQSVLNVAFYIFIQQIQVLNILNTVYTARFFFKMQFVS